MQGGGHGGGPEGSFYSVNLSDRHPIFVGLKLDSQMKRLLASLTGTERRYVSSDDPTFLLLCRLGDAEYVGKLIPERMTTDRIDDVRRNVLSILQRLFPDTRFPAQLDIIAAESTAEATKIDP